MDSSRNNILKRLKSIDYKNSTLPHHDFKNESKFFSSPDDCLDIIFAEAFNKNGGKFIFCESLEEIFSTLKILCKKHNWNNVYCWETQLQKILKKYDFAFSSTKKNLINAEVGITTCDALIARTGSILLNSQSSSGRSLSIIPSIHIVIASTNQLVYNLKDVLKLQTARESKFPSMLCFTSTNSQTADIEKTLVNGAHGPKELYVFMLED